MVLKRAIEIIQNFAYGINPQAEFCRCQVYVSSLFSFYQLPDAEECIRGRCEGTNGWFKKRIDRILACNETACV